MTLSEHGGKTTLTMHGRPINASEEERRTFEAGRDSMQKIYRNFRSARRLSGRKRGTNQGSRIVKTGR